MTSEASPVAAVHACSTITAAFNPLYRPYLVITIGLTMACTIIGAPLAINPDRFQRAGGDLEAVLKQICDEVHRYGDVAVKNNFTVPWPNKSSN